MKLVSKHSDFKGFFKSLLIGFIIIVFYFDARIILKNKYETTGNWGYIVLALLISVSFLRFLLYF